MKRSEIIIRAVLVLFGLALGLGALEIGLRILRPTRAGSEFESLADLRKSMLSVDSKLSGIDPAFSGSTPADSVSLGAITQPHPSDDIIFDLRPNLDVIFQGVRTTTNSCGMRDREYPLAKPPNTYRIALLGDSFAFGWGADQQKSFGRVLEQILNNTSGDHPRFEVLNFGVPGYSTFQEVGAFLETGLEFDPDAVLVFFIENDFGLPFYIRDIYNPDQLLPSLGLSRAAGEALGKDALEQIRATPFDANRAFLKLLAATKERGIPVFLAINPRENWKKMLQKLWMVRNRPEITVLDLRDNYLDIVRREGLKDEDLHIPNDGHPTALKHGVFARILAPYFLSVAHEPQ